MLPRERPGSAATCLEEFTSLVGLELAHVVYHGLNERVDGFGRGELLCVEVHHDLESLIA